jgi:exopolysaccharide biosynthesis polyprenyl glycosylphosphotransferase
MSQNELQAFAEPNHPLNATAGSHASGATPTRRFLATHARPSMLARQLSAPAVQVLDQAGLLIAFALTRFDTPVRQGQSLASYLALRVSVRNLVTGLALIAIWRTILWTVGMYHPHINRRAVVFLWKVPAAILLCAAPVIPLMWSKGLDSSLRSASLFWLAASILLLTIRASVLTYEESIRPLLRPLRTVVICGTGPLARIQALDLPSNRQYRYQLLGFVDDEPHEGVEMMGPVLCGVRDLERLLMHRPVDEVIIGLPLKSHFGEVEEIVRICGRAGVQIQYSLDLFNTEIAKKQKVVMDRTNRVVMEMVHLDQRVLVKDAVDRTLAAIGLFFLWPVFLAIAVAIKASSPGPVFFVQQRFGLNKRRFGMIKFRSMVIDAEAKQAALEHLNENAGPTFKIKRDPRITRVGAFIRSTSLDELPQLLNVIKGEMSLIGPRPLPTRDVERFSEPWLMRRFSVKPGITGLWQVSGRSNTDFDAAIQLDLRYIDRWSPLMDIQILLRTFHAVVRRSGAY